MGSWMEFWVQFWVQDKGVIWMGQERSEKQSESGSLSQRDQPRRDLSYGFPLRPGPELSLGPLSPSEERHREY